MCSFIVQMPSVRIYNVNSYGKKRKAIKCEDVSKLFTGTYKKSRDRESDFEI